MKIDIMGNALWEKKYYADILFFASVAPVSDGGYLIAGYTYRSAYGYVTQGIALKTDAFGDIEWSQAYMQAQTQYALVLFSGLVAADNTCIFGGALKVPLTGSNINNGILMRTDAGGNINGITGVDDIYSSQLHYVSQTPDSSFVAAGLITMDTSMNSSLLSIFLMKTTNSGSTGCKQQFPDIVVEPILLYSQQLNVTSSLVVDTILPVAFNLFSGDDNVSNVCNQIPVVILNDGIFIFPNPVEQIINFRSMVYAINGFEIFNILGELVIEQQFSFVTNETAVDLSSLNTGIYFVRVKTEKGTFVRKFFML